MVNALSDTLNPEASSPYLATLEDIQRLRFDYLLAHPEWIASAHANDPALNKYEQNYDMASYIQENPQAFEEWIDGLSQQHTVLKDYLENEKTGDAMRELLARTPEILELESYPGLTVIAAHEKAHELYMQAQQAENPFDALSDFAAARRLSEAAKSVGGGDIHPGAQLGKDLFIDHVSGGVIGETAIVGDRCFLLHGVTLGGAKKTKPDSRVAGGERRHPALGDEVEVGSNANIYGACDIGDKVKVKTGATIIDSDISHYATEEHPEVRPTEIGAGARITDSTIKEGAAIYANANVFRSEIAENVKVNANVNLSKAKIGEGSKLGIDARLADCTVKEHVEIGSNADIAKATIEKGAIIRSNVRLLDCTIGEGAIIGEGVSLEGVTVPPYAEIYEVGQPKLAVYDPRYEGVVTVRGTAQSPKEHFERDSKQFALASDFLTEEDIPNAVLRPEDIALMREANDFIAQWQATIQEQKAAEVAAVRH